jgi:flagellar protein FliL
MAKKKKAEEGSEDTEAEGGKGGGGKMMPAAMISLALVAAGYFVGGRGGGAAPAAEATVITVIAPEPEVETIIDLEPININLADGHYLRIAISIGMAAAHEEASGEAAAAGHGAATDTATTEPTAPAADLVLSTFAGKTMEELSTLEGRVAARDHLQEGLKEFYGEEVLTVFFTEFVMQ